MTYDDVHTCWNKTPGQCHYIREESAYHHPEIWGWAGFASLNLTDGAYEFKILAVLQRPDGSLVYGISSGCSCPTPFEEYRSQSDWVPITSITGFSAAVNGYYDAKYDSPGFPQQFSELLERLSLAGVPA